MITEFYVGETINISADDLTLRDGTPVTSGATVVISIADDETRIVESTATITEPTSGDDWGTDLTAPDRPGTYVIKVSATKSGKVCKAVQEITVLNF